MTPLENLLEKLPGARKAGNGWSACCPAHDDQKASLSVSAGTDGSVLVKCHAGCTTEAVLNAVGSTLRDLFPQGRGTRQRPKSKLGRSARHLPRPTTPYWNWNVISR